MHHLATSLTYAVNTLNNRLLSRFPRRTRSPSSSLSSSSLSIANPKLCLIPSSSTTGVAPSAARFVPRFTVAFPVRGASDAVLLMDVLRRVDVRVPTDGVPFEIGLASAIVIEVLLSIATTSSGY